jgi:hypothetical protein
MNAKNLLEAAMRSCGECRLTAIGSPVTQGVYGFFLHFTITLLPE